MWNFSITRALGAMARTWPFIGLRMAVYFGIALLYVVATGGVASLGYLISQGMNGDSIGAMYGAFAGFAGASGVLYWFREYVLYLVKAGHIAALVRLHDGKDIPAGLAQLSDANRDVRGVFAEASMLFGLDQIIKGVLRMIAGTLNAIASILPIPYLDRLMGMVNAVVRMSLTFSDELILAHMLRSSRDNPWLDARDALVLYAQNYAQLLKNAVWLTLFVWLLTVALFIVLLPVVASVFVLLPPESGVWPLLLSLLLAWAFKQALIDPVAMYALLQVYLRLTADQQPDAELSAKLDKLSDKFRELGRKAERLIEQPQTEVPSKPEPGTTGAQV